MLVIGEIRKNYDNCRYTVLPTTVRDTTQTPTSICD